MHAHILVALFPFIPLLIRARGVVVDEPDLKIVEYSYCPLGDAFSKLGRNVEMLGDLFCSVTDNAFLSGFNPDWSITREKKFSKYGFCRLVWK
jgi:hypothetical protein